MTEDQQPQLQCGVCGEPHGTGDHNRIVANQLQSNSDLQQSESAVCKGAHGAFCNCTKGHPCSAHHDHAPLGPFQTPDEARVALRDELCPCHPDEHPTGVCVCACDESTRYLQRCEPAECNPNHMLCVAAVNQVRWQAAELRAEIERLHKLHHSLARHMDELEAENQHLQEACIGYRAHRDKVVAENKRLRRAIDYALMGFGTEADEDFLALFRRRFRKAMER